MAVVVVYQAGDGTLFVDRNLALAYDAALNRRNRIMTHFKTHKTLLTDTGHLQDRVYLNDVVDCLVADAAIFRSTILV